MGFARGKVPAPGNVIVMRATEVITRLRNETACTEPLASFLPAHFRSDTILTSDRARRPSSNLLLARGRRHNLSGPNAHLRNREQSFRLR